MCLTFHQDKEVYVCVQYSGLYLQIQHFFNRCSYFLFRHLRKDKSYNGPFQKECKANSPTFCSKYNRFSLHKILFFILEKTLLMGKIWVSISKHYKIL